MMVMPSGLRSSEPVPCSNASGIAPNSAASVVIMIGRNRRIEACTIASRGVRPCLRSASSAKSMIMIAFFFTMPISRMMPISATTERSILNQHQREQRADAGRRQRGQDRERVDEALVQHAEHDVDRDRGGEDEPWLAGERLGEFGRVARIGAGERARHVDGALGLGDDLHGVAERGIGREIEADGDGRKLLLVRDHQRRGGVLEPRDRAERNHRELPAVEITGAVGFEVSDVEAATAWLPDAGT